MTAREINSYADPLFDDATFACEDCAGTGLHLGMFDEPCETCAGDGTYPNDDYEELN